MKCENKDKENKENSKKSDDNKKNSKKSDDNKPKKLPRCPNGTRRNKKTMKCEPKQ